MDRAAINMAIALELQERRKAAGLTAEQMWTALKWKRNTYRRTEDGVRDVPVRELFQVAAVVGVSPEALFSAVIKRIQAH
ncbi:helix-turn-helix domain-containing protein [Nocardia sp. NPDC088792]|uniref:helix-turn-helix domain-containing protein n=1 Tax=Nocardia sp. NPDC088792 TaxID=3364332 RepID=UPI0037F4C5CB